MRIPMRLCYMLKIYKQTVIGSIINTNKEDQYHFERKEKKRIFTLISYNFCIPTPILKLKVKISIIYIEFLARCENLQFNPTTKLIDGVGSAHNHEASYTLKHIDNEACLLRY